MEENNNIKAEDNKFLRLFGKISEDEVLQHKLSAASPEERLAIAQSIEPDFTKENFDKLCEFFKDHQAPEELTDEDLKAVVGGDDDFPWGEFFKYIGYLAAGFASGSAICAAGAYI